MMDEKELLEAIGKMLEPIAKEQREIRDDLRAVKEDVNALKADNVKLITLEKNVSLILEAQQGINEKFEKLDTVADDVEEIKLTVRAMEAVTQRNSMDIKKLRAVK